MVKLTVRTIGFLFFVAFFAFPARADTVGQNTTFSVDGSYGFQGRTSVGATLRFSSQRAYAYVEDGYWDSLVNSDQTLIFGYIERIVNEFNSRIYPMETQTFGSEPNPGIDNDPKITILFTRLIDTAGGYFNTSDCYARSPDNKTSNQREMFYLNIGMISDELRMKTFLAHEFQHLISFNQKEMTRNISDDTWLNEMRSEYAISLLGYNDSYPGSNLEKRVQSFLANSSDSLTEWKNNPIDYGQIALFGQYLAEHWGGKVLSDTLKNNVAGIQSLNIALASNGFSDDFSAVFKNWMIANILNDSSFNPKYGYLKSELKKIRITPTKVSSYLTNNITFAVGDSIKDWQARWYDILNFAPDQSPVLKINFNSPSLASFEISYVTIKSDGTVENRTFHPVSNNSSLYIDGIGSDISRVILMPLKKDRISGFGADENAVTLALTIIRIKEILVATPTPTPALPPITPIPRLKPSDFSLHEGDFIRAEGDIDVYIINDFGYKRLILNPAICLMYGHLGARGCFSAVKIVSPLVRDAFVASNYITNGDPPPGGQDGKIYKLEPTGDDTASLHWLNITGADFAGQGGDFNSVFLINTNEQASYQIGASLAKI